MWICELKGQEERFGKGRRGSGRSPFFCSTATKTIFFERRATTNNSVSFSAQCRANFAHMPCALIRFATNRTTYRSRPKQKSRKNPKFLTTSLQGPRRPLARSGRRPYRLLQLRAHGRELEGLPGPGLSVPRELRPARSHRHLRLCGAERATSGAPAAAVRLCAANAAAVCGK